MRFEVLALLGVLAESTSGQRLLRRQAGYTSSLNSTVSAVSNSTASSSSSSSSSSWSSSSSSSTSSSSSSSSITTTAFTTTSSNALPAGYSTPSYTSTEYHFNSSLVGSGTAPPTPLGTGSSASISSSTKANETIVVNDKTRGCNGQTLNVLSASLDWWYTRTVYNVVSTFSVTTNKNDSKPGWTLLPATTAFDLSSALVSPTCTPYETWNSVFNQTLVDYSCFPAPTPVAASTTVITQNAFTRPNATTGTGPAPSVVITPAPAVITIPDDGGSYTQGTGFVFFSQYEIVTRILSTFSNGSSACAAATQTYPMDKPFSFEYVEGDVNGTEEVGAGVTGDVNPAFLGIAGVSNAQAGSWVAEPTVAILVQNIVAEKAVFAALARPGFMTTETVLQTPSATLPDFNTPTPPPPPVNSPTPPPNNIESTQTKLQTPTGPNRTNNPPPPGQTSPNSPQTGRTGQPPNTQHTGQPGQPQNTPRPSPTDRLGGFGGAISFIFSAIRPTTTTNALSVLESALETFPPHGNPTAGAIIHGINGPRPQTTPAPLGPVPGGQPNGVGTGPDGRPVVVVNGQTFTGDSSTHFVLGPGETLSPGGEVIMHGTTISLAQGMSSLVVDSRTFGASHPMITSGPITVGGAVFVPVAGDTYDIDGQTLTPGGVITMDGTVISLASPATAVVIDGQTSDIAIMTAPAVLTFDGQTFTANNGGTFVIDGQTLTPGGVIIVDGTTMSLEPGATAVVVDGQTSALGAAGSITAAPTLTIGSETFTGINGKPTYVIDGETLTPGEVETVAVDGTTYILSLAPGATLLKIETENSNGVVTATTYETLTAAGSSPTTSTAVVGAVPSAGPSASVAPATGAATLVTMQISGICIAIGSLALAVWL